MTATMSRTILAIDDSENTLKLLSDFLSNQSFNVITAGSGQEAFEQMETANPDLILLDIMMPTMDGYQFISRVRRSNNVPIIMLTAKRQESDIVRGFELGVDDYVTKPYRMRELLMRIRAVLKRSSTPLSVDNTHIVGDITLNSKNFLVIIRGETIDLTVAEFHLLETLVKSAELTVHRATLCMNLIEHGFSGSENTLKIHIRNIRQKIEPDPQTPIYIETVFGIGYRLREINS